MLCAVRAILLWVPLDPHPLILRHWLTQSMSDPAALLPGPVDIDYGQPVCRGSVLFSGSMIIATLSMRLAPGGEADTIRSKSLSHKAEHDDGGRELHEREVILRFLLPAREQLPVAVEPGVRAFHDPAARPCAASTGAAFFTPRANVGDIAPMAQGARDRWGVVALVEAEMLLGVGRGPHDALVEQRAQAALIMPVGRRDQQPDGDAAPVGEDMALRATLAPVGGVGPRFFPHPAGLCGASCRPTATATRARARRHSIRAAAATSLPTRPWRPSVGSVDARSSQSRRPPAPPSTGSRCAARRGRHRALAATVSRGARRRVEILAPAAPPSPTPPARPECARSSPVVGHVAHSPSPPLHRPAACGHRSWGSRSFKKDPASQRLVG